MTSQYPTQQWGPPQPTPPPPPPPKGNGRKALLIIGGIIGGLFLIGSLFSSDPDPATTVVPAAAAPTTAAPVTTEPATTETTEAPAITKPKPKLTMSQEQAIGTAQDYLDSQGFSKAGLIEQLSSPYGSDFNKADATFAVNYLKVNWNEQAVRVARDYLATQNFSRNGLIEQLSSPYGSQFTRAQATYAASKVGL
jgi:Host cell surface-exposed lipoprotein